MSINKISNTLSKYKDLTPPDDSLRSYVVEYCTRELHIPLKKEDVKINNQTVHIKTTPLYKSEIFLKKRTLVQEIKKTFPASFINDVR